MNTSVLLITTIAFCVVNGANDGATLVAMNLSSKALRPLTALMLLALAIVVGPFVVGTAVATTLAVGLTRFDAAEGADALLYAVVVTIGVIYAASRLGLPSSVTFALTGSIIGIGIGRGLPVEPDVAIRVMVIGVAAPLVAGGLGTGIAAALSRTRPRSSLRRHLRWLHATSFGAQCLAYAANDAQKMTALFAIGSGAVGSRGVVPDWSLQALIGVSFFAGTLLGVVGLGSRVNKLLPVRPLNSISAGFASAGAVLGAAFAGSPVSMGQANASALVGSQVLLVTYRRVRWEQAARIVLAWFATLPAALVIALVLGRLTK